MSRIYEHLTWPEVADAVERGAGVVLPLGSIEQHGPHLPLETDSLLARELAAAGSAAHDVLVAPLLPLGYRSRPLTGGGPSFPGTVSLSGATFVAVLREIVERFLEQGFTRLLLYSWHMENAGFVYEAAYTAAAARDGVKVVVMETPFDSLSPETMELVYGDEFPGWPAEHASILETSMMLHLRPDLVHMPRAVDDRVAREPPYDIVPPPSELTTRSGVLYKATRGSAEKGDAAFREIAAKLAEVLDAEFPELGPAGRAPR